MLFSFSLAGAKLFKGRIRLTVSPYQKPPSGLQQIRFCAHQPINPAKLFGKEAPSLVDMQQR
jgi:hypothetical protein